MMYATVLMAGTSHGMPASLQDSCGCMRPDSATKAASMVGVLVVLLVSWRFTGRSDLSLCFRESQASPMTQEGRQWLMNRLPFLLISVRMSERRIDDVAMGRLVVNSDLNAVSFGSISRFGTIAAPTPPFFNS